MTEIDKLITPPPIPNREIIVDRCFDTYNENLTIGKQYIVYQFTEDDIYTERAKRGDYRQIYMRLNIFSLVDPADKIYNSNICRKLVYTGSEIYFTDIFRNDISYPSYPAKTVLPDTIGFIPNNDVYNKRAVYHYLLYRE